MDLQQINVWDIKMREGRIDGIEDRSARLVYTGYKERLGGGIIGDETVALCGDDDLVTRDVVLLDELGDEAL